MGADKSSENYPNAPEFLPKFLLKLSAQAQKFGILTKKASFGVRS